MAPQLIFGTASFGMDGTAFQDAGSIKELFAKLQELGIFRLDTGARYPPSRPGGSETLIGEAITELGGFDLTVDTKVYTDTRTDGSGDLTPEQIGKSANASLERLQRPQGVRFIYPPGEPAAWCAAQRDCQSDHELCVRSMCSIFIEQIPQRHWKIRSVASMSRLSRDIARL